MPTTLFTLEPVGMGLFGEPVMLQCRLSTCFTEAISGNNEAIHVVMVSYRIALNYGPSVYFFPVIFNQATKRDKRLLSGETHAVYNL